MKAIKFTLSGKFAHFKKPDVNSYAYFTYSHIHKISLLGIFGAILGLKGYGNKEVEFYNNLKHLKIAIIPKKPYFTKKIQTFNNSVGYASKEEGGNLVVREQWLENVGWDIVVLDDESREFVELKERLVSKNFYYIPYLGKNDFPATFSDIEELELSKLQKGECISLIPKNRVEFVSMPRRGVKFYYEEYLPIGLNDKLIYQFDKFILSSWIVEGEMYGIDNKGIWCG
jgi:CRISPR-associated protein Cas5h